MLRKGRANRAEMKTKKIMAACLFLLIILLLLAPSSHAGNDEVIIIEEWSEEIVEVEGEGDIPLNEGELPTYQYEVGTGKLPENVTWENGRLILCGTGDGSMSRFS